MAVARVSGIGIAGVYAGVPTGIVENSSMTDLATPAELQKVIKGVGVERRRVAPEGLCTSDLAHAAAIELMADLGWAREDIDLLVFVSQSGDYVLPATACLLQNRLGLPKSCAAFDLGLGCSGYVYGLWVTSQLLGSLGGKKALLLVGDTSTWSLAPNDRAVQFLFGDAATATAIERRPDAPDMTFVLGTDGGGGDHLIIPGGGKRSALTKASFDRQTGADGVTRGPMDLFMDGPQVFNFTLREVPALIAQTLVSANWTLDSVSKFVFHQANVYLIDYLAKRSKLPADRVVKALQNYGNTSSASIPLAIADKLGDQLAREDSNLLLAGFGVGWSWGGAAISLAKGTKARVIEVDAEHLKQAAAQ
jgi:3-oxoacyl-[acyl-carrier-protein] synthase-3